MMHWLNTLRIHDFHQSEARLQQQTAQDDLQPTKEDQLTSLPDNDLQATKEDRITSVQDSDLQAAKEDQLAPLQDNDLQATKEGQLTSLQDCDLQATKEDELTSVQASDPPATLGCTSQDGSTGGTITTNSCPVSNRTKQEETDRTNHPV